MRLEKPMVAEWETTIMVEYLQARIACLHGPSLAAGPSDGQGIRAAVVLFGSPQPLQPKPNDRDNHNGRPSEGTCSLATLPAAGMIRTTDWHRSLSSGVALQASQQPSA